MLIFASTHLLARPVGPDQLFAIALAACRLHPILPADCTSKSKETGIGLSLIVLEEVIGLIYHKTIEALRLADHTWKVINTLYRNITTRDPRYNLQI